MSLALTKISAEWVSPATYTINDLIVQRYPPGCKGITPHRDHLAYRIIIAILLVSGDGEFRIHRSRNEPEGQVIQFCPGDLLVMGAPGIFAGFFATFPLLLPGYPDCAERSACVTIADLSRLRADSGVLSKLMTFLCFLSGAVWYIAWTLT